MKKSFICAIAAAMLALQAAGAQALCVNAASANLRSGPGTRYETLWEVFRYMPLELVEKRGVWLRVKDFAGDMYWVYGPNLTDAYRCAVVKDEQAEVRAGGPGAANSPHAISPAQKYSAFKVIREEGGWVEVENEFDARGWVAASALWVN